VIAKGLCCTY